MREIENIEKKKKQLILTIMADKFEENIASIIEGGNYGSIEELDQIVEQKLRRYYEECDLVVDYYDKKIYS